MKILVISDSHKNLINLKQVLDKAEYDYVLFLGDYVMDIMNFKRQLNDKLFVVKGNCDGDINFDDDLFIEIAGKKIFMTHGHKYGVKLGMKKLFQKATELDADIAVFGHTHIAFQTQLDSGLIVLNPGSVGKGMLKNNTFGIIEIDEEGLVTSKIFRIPWLNNLNFIIT